MLNIQILYMTQTWVKHTHKKCLLYTYSSLLSVTFYYRGVKLIFTRGHISLSVAFKGLNIILGLYKCNCSLTRGKELGAAAG